MDWDFGRAAAAFDEVRLPLTVVCGGLWLAVLLANALIYTLPKLLSRSTDGPSHLPVVGSIFGLFTLLLAPVATLPLRLLALPLALLPDLLVWCAFWLMGRLWPDETPRPPGDRE